VRERHTLPGLGMHGYPTVDYVEHLEAHGEALFAKVCEIELDGIVAKQADSP
jgi:ATP-dependent DNA ligase